MIHFLTYPAVVSAQELTSWSVRELLQLVATVWKPFFGGSTMHVCVCVCVCRLSRSSTHSSTPAR
jgi:hypothetical protein